MASLMLCLLVSLPAQAARLALVIGNDGYRQIEPLKNARNDARLMAATLMEAGFEVERVFENLDREAMYDALHIFTSRIKKGDEVVFFYAGHGAQFGATPVLLPTDIKKDNEKKMEVNSVALSYVQAQFKEAGFSLLVIDACRDNPFDSADASGTRGLERSGLSMITVATGNAIIMSASRGQKALDYIPGNPRSANSLFTHELVQAIKTPGQDVHTALREVRERVEDKAKLAGNLQLPDLEDKTRGRFFFHHVKPAAAQVVATAPAVQLTSEQEIEQKFWNVIESSNDVQDFQDYLKRYPNGRFAPLAQRQVRVLTARQQLAQVKTPVAVDIQPQPAPAQTSVAAPASRALGKRVALLIGNDKYEYVLRLMKMVSDTQLVKQSLQELGFEVTLVADANARDLLGKLGEFTNKKAMGAEVAMVYLAGHGVRYDNKDYFVPVDIKSVAKPSDLENGTFNVSRLEESMDKWGSALSILVVDGDRANPFATSRGFQVSAPKSEVVVFSSKPGKSPLDGDGINTPFATAFAASLKNKSLSLFDVLENTRLAVMRETRNEQEPVFTGNGLRNLYLGQPLSAGPSR